MFLVISLARQLRTRKEDIFIATSKINLSLTYRKITISLTIVQTFMDFLHLLNLKY